jgi:hypothetical protein
MLSCWIPEDLRQELDRAWAEQGLRPHGRTQKGMEQMIQHFLAQQAEAPLAVPAASIDTAASH